MLSNIIALILFPVLVAICFMHRYDSGEFEKEFLGKRQTTVLKGIMILVVFFHHFSHICQSALDIEFAYRMGQYCMTFFFFLSGYTEGLGHIRGKNKLNEKWVNRVWRLYLPVMVFTLPFNNFLTPLLIFFVLSDAAFYIFDSNAIRLLVIAAGNIAYVVIYKLIGQREYWYDDVLTFFVGIAMAMYKDEIIKFFKNKILYAITFLLSAAICAVTVYTGMNGILFDISVIVNSFFGCIIIILLIMKLNAKSKFFYLVGQHSWEIYMLHQAFMILLSKVISKYSVVMILSFLLSLGCGMLLQSRMLAFREKLVEKKLKNRAAT